MSKGSIKDITKGNNLLNNKLYHEVVKKKPGENLIMSPLSLHTVLSLLHQGSNEKTCKDLAKVLNLPEKTKSAEGYQKIMCDLNNVDKITLAMANKVYSSSGVKTSFEEVAKTSFYAESEFVNFEENKKAAKIINTWVEEKTKDKIKNLIDPSSLNKLTRVVLVNAIYFKGDWENKFNDELTSISKFYTSKKTSIDCYMMYNKGRYGWCSISELSASALSIRYKNEDFSMIIILPNKTDGINNLEKAILNFDIAKAMNKMEFRDVKLSLPKFKIVTTMDLNEPLKQMGLEIIFSGSANFSGISNEPLFVSNVIQQAFIEVNEEGAEAAAATAVVMRLKCASAPVSWIEFVADHPFLFYLMKNDQCLFSGKLAQPT